MLVNWILSHGTWNKNRKKYIINTTKYQMGLQTHDDVNVSIYNVQS